MVIIIFSLILLLAIIIVIPTVVFRRAYSIHARAGLARTSNIKRELLLEDDIARLPEPVKKYIRYTGAVNREKVLSARICFSGSLQEVNKPPFRVKVEQTSFFDNYTRLFRVRGTMMGLPVIALHKYFNGKATFEVKPFSLFHVVNEKGGSLNTAETVTFFNDMCLLAPATLTDRNITWEQIDDYSVKGRLTVNGINVSATLIFNEEGQLVSFWSDDRYYRSSEGKMEKIRWTTPVSEFRNYNGIMLGSYGEAIWSFPDGDFRYAIFRLEDVKYNIDK
jgi:hypothetical protein